MANLIAKTQLDNGEIPWFRGDKTDPWDHVESIMGLTIGGYVDQARLGFQWLVNNQLENGGWYSSFKNGKPEDKTVDTNLTAYIAVGVYHHYLITGDLLFVRQLWPTVRKAVDHAVGLQAPSGEIYWATSPAGVVDPMALLTGSSSIYMSLKCALALADLLQVPMPSWESALSRLGEAIRCRPHLFNVTKSRFSMDWFYPILCGALTGDQAQRRIDKYWKKFVVDGLGVRCVSDQPWITIAETSEFVLALSAMGNHRLAGIVFSWIQDKCYEDGSCWCGFTFPDMVIWPEDKITWTNAVVLMAADALYHLTPAAGLFRHEFWSGSRALSGVESS
ncbi:MAG: phenyltransferase domain-containing protein [Thermodesulfobacteriota bacterium]